MALKPSELAPIELIAAYIAGLGLTTIRLVSETDGAGPVSLEVSAGLRVPTADVTTTTTVLESFAFSSESHAELVALTIGTTTFDAHATAREAIVDAAESVGAPWRATAEVIAIAAADIAEIERHLLLLKLAGGLAWFNAQYKAYRKHCVATLTPAIQYSLYLHTLKLKMVELAGQNVAAGRDKFVGLDAIRMDKPAEIVPPRQFKNVGPKVIDKYHHEPLHHTRNAVHKSRRLKP